MIPALLLVFVLPIATAALAHFLQLTFQKGMIFRWYYALITYWFKFKPRAKRHVYKSAHYLGIETLLAVECFPAKRAAAPRQVIYLPELWYAWFAKPLGLCIYCHSVWLGTPFYALASLALGMGLEALWIWPLFVGVQYAWVKLLGRWIDE